MRLETTTSCLRSGGRSRVMLRKPERGGVAECRGAWKAAGNLCGQLRCRAVEMQKSASWTQVKTAFRRQSHVQHCPPRKPAA